MALRRLRAALRCWPTPRDWTSCGGIGLAGALFCYAAAHIGGLVGFAPVRDNALVFGALTTLFFVPALAEEILFRGLMVPQGRGVRSLLGVMASVALFTLWHPLQAITFGPPRSGLFLDPWFLVAVTALGITLTAQYRVSHSLWPPVLTHWLIVAAWKLLFGGPF
ncbi:MAG: CPBP family glutamic-type intramembrane protease [Pacificimonas sp.]